MKQTRRKVIREKQRGGSQHRRVPRLREGGTLALATSAASCRERIDSAASCRERIDVGLSRKKELPEADPTITQRLVEAQQQQVVPEAVFGECTRTSQNLAARHESLDRV